MKKKMESIGETLDNQAWHSECLSYRHTKTFLVGFQGGEECVVLLFGFVVERFASLMSV